MAGALLSIGWLHLATPVLAALFAYLALTKLHFSKRSGKWLPIILFVILFLGLAYALGFFIKSAVDSLPRIADKAIPLIINWAKDHKIELPFTDYDSLKDIATDAVKSQVHYLSGFARFARGATSQSAYLLIGCVMAMGIFLNPRLELGREQHRIPNNLYSLCCDQIAERVTTFYNCFATVMGAQVVISAINTVFTSIFVVCIHLPNALVVIGMTFLCGLLPILGNLISNSILVGIAFTESPKVALIALGYLVVIHKFEYFLNGKIIGDRIKNPLWLTLLALILGERLMGIPGMMLAPVVLSYVQLESSVVEV